MAKRNGVTKQRDYKAEYRRRIERAISKGYSRSVARGHAKRGEAGIRAARFLGIKPGTDLDRLVAKDARKVFGFKPKRQGGEGTLEYEEKLRELQKRRGRFEWTDEYEFVKSLTDLGMTEQDAYTHWFSP